MTPHPSDEALLDLAEGSASGREHLEGCATCRERVEVLRETIGLLREDTVPEPSPLFWQHFSDRVARSLDEAPAGSYARWLMPRWTWGLAAAAAIVAVLVIVPRQTTPIGAGTSQPPAPRIAQTVAPHEDPATDVSWALADTDASWRLVEGAAADLDLDAASDAGIFVRPGSVDSEVLLLSEQDRRELARVIQAELDRSRL